MRLVPRDGLEKLQRVFEVCENSHGLTGGGIGPKPLPEGCPTCVYLQSSLSSFHLFFFGEKIKFFSPGPRPSLLYVPSAVLDSMTGSTVSSFKARVLNQTRRNVL